MFVDIHTHNQSKTEYPTIRNLDFSQAEELFSSDEKGFFSVGFHPWYADEFSTQKMDKLEKWTADKRFVAIGECGLDKNSKVSLEKQMEVFKKQIDLSEKVNIPQIIHCVGCFNELFELRTQFDPHQIWIIHGFRGKPELAKQILKSGCALSFGEHFNPESIRVTPIDKLFIETDESIEPIDNLYRQIAEIKELSPEQLSAGENLLEIFYSQ